MDTYLTNIAAREIIEVDRTARVEVLDQVAGTHTYRNLIVRHMAEYLDPTLRAHNSSIKQRVTNVLCGRYGVETLALQMVSLQLPIKEIMTAGISKAARRVWNETALQCVRYPVGRNDSAVKTICSTYVNYSEHQCCREGGHTSSKIQKIGSTLRSRSSNMLVGALNVLKVGK